LNFALSEARRRGNDFNGKPAPGEAIGRAGLILGYIAVGMVFALVVLMAIAWMSIRAR
jgi:hypothetical protein